VSGVADGILPPLFSAIRKNNVECVKALVKAGADVNYTNEDEISPWKFNWNSSTTVKEKKESKQE
jgi:ankyrin repeat protein